jgi:hypothetical protein
MPSRDLLDLLNTLNPRCTRLLVDVREHLQEASTSKFKRTLVKVRCLSLLSPHPWPLIWGLST